MYEPLLRKTAYACVCVCCLFAGLQFPLVAPPLAILLRPEAIAETEEEYGSLRCYQNFRHMTPCTSFKLSGNIVFFCMWQGLALPHNSDYISLREVEVLDHIGFGYLRVQDLQHLKALRS